MPRSRAGRQEQGPLRRPFSVQLHFRGAPYRGVPRPVPSFDPPEVRAGHIPGRPQDLVPGAGPAAQATLG